MDHSAYENGKGQYIYGRMDARSIGRSPTAQAYRVFGPSQVPVDHPTERFLSMKTVESVLETLGIMLPQAQRPVAAYVPVRNGGRTRLREWASTNERWAARGLWLRPIICERRRRNGCGSVCAINALAALKAALEGDLDRIAGIVRVGVFVASDAGFFGQPAIADGVSTLLVDVFGESGRHARAAVGSVALPLGATVEVEMIVELR